MDEGLRVNGRDGTGIVSLTEDTDRLIITLIRLVKYEHSIYMVYSKFSNYLIYRVHMLFKSGAADIHYMEEKVRIFQFIQRCPEGAKQIIRKLFDDLLGAFRAT